MLFKYWNNYKSDKANISTNEKQQNVYKVNASMSKYCFSNETCSGTLRLAYASLEISKTQLQKCNLYTSTTQFLYLAFFLQVH